MNSLGQLQAFVRANDLEGTRSARIERDGRLYYVLLLGVYATRELAEQAALTLPAPLASGEPWIRSLGSLQNAMRRANALAGGPSLDDDP